MKRLLFDIKWSCTSQERCPNSPNWCYRSVIPRCFLSRWCCPV